MLIEDCLESLDIFSIRPVVLLKGKEYISTRIS